jgi:EamA domain-containing membrane protein RarD
MRKIFFVLAIIFTFIGILTTILPLGSIAFLPIGLAVVFGLLTLLKSDENQIKIPKVLLLICGVCTVTVFCKILFIKDEVIQDTKFEQTKIETKQEAKKDLEDLEGL